MVCRILLRRVFYSSVHLTFNVYISLNRGSSNFASVSWIWRCRSFLLSISFFTVRWLGNATWDGLSLNSVRWRFKYLIPGHGPQYLNSVCHRRFLLPLRRNLCYDGATLAAQLRRHSHGGVFRRAEHILHCLCGPCRTLASLGGSVPASLSIAIFLHPPALIFFRSFLASSCICSGPLHYGIFVNLPSHFFFPAFFPHALTITASLCNFWFNFFSSIQIHQVLISVDDVYAISFTGQNIFLSIFLSHTAQVFFSWAEHQSFSSCWRAPVRLSAVSCHAYEYRLQLKCDSMRWRTGEEVKGKLANGVDSQYSSHYHGTWCIQHYYSWCAHLGCQ